MDWEQRERIWDEARKKANVDHYISPEGNPLRKLIEPHTMPFDYNMSVLEKDYHAREKPVHGQIYAGIMDNMRYGGNE